MGTEIGALVRDIIDVAGTIYAITSDRVYRWDTTLWTLIGTATIGATGLKCLATDGTDLYVGGDVTVMTGTAISGKVAKWTGSWATVGASNGGVNLVNDLIFFGGVLYGGNSVSINGSTDLLKKFTAGAWSTVLTSHVSSGDVFRLAVQGDNLIIAYNGGYVASWDGAASTATTIGTATGYGHENASDRDALAVYLADIVYGADFTGINSVTNYNNIARYSGGTWQKYGSGFSIAAPVGRNDRIADLCFIGSDLYAGGLFTTADGKPIANLAVYVTSFESLMDHLSHDNGFDLGAAIHSASGAGSLVDADEVPIWYSMAGTLAKVTWLTIKNSLWTALGALIAGGSAKTTPIDADTIALSDSADSNATKKLSWSNIKATLKTYFDTLYNPLQLIADTTLGSDTANFDFTSIPSTYKHLKLVLSLRSDVAATSDGVFVRFNNDTAANYDYIVVVLYTTMANAEGLGQTAVWATTTMGNNAVASDFGTSYIDVIDYASTTPNKSSLSVGGWRGSTSTNFIRLYNGHGHWRSTAAINRITIYPQTGTNWKTGSRATLFGVK
jgi:hypothetical protein